MSIPDPVIISPTPSELPPGSEALWVRFWGVRGNIPTPHPNFSRYGGNTVCVQVQAGEHCLIFDGGTGLKDLGEALCEQSWASANPPDPLHLHLFFTHSQWDRIQGFPFFQPAFHAHNHLKIYGSIATNGASIKHRLMAQMTRPSFTMPLRDMQATLEFHNLVPGDHLSVAPDLTLETFGINRYDRSLGYRITYKNQVLVYATDVETQRGKTDAGLVYLAQNADLLIYDMAQDAHRLCGDPKTGKHSQRETTIAFETLWPMALELCQVAHVKQLVLCHHNPWWQDADLAQADAQIQAQITSSCFAQEGMVIHLG